MERKFWKKRFLISFFIATLIFSLGFLISYMTNFYQYQTISSSQERMRYNLLELEINKRLVDCDSFSPYFFSTEMDYMGSIIEKLEQEFGKDDKRVLEQKKIYSLIQTQHFFYVLDHNNVCDNKFDTILFFYSNSKQHIDESERIGFILSSFKRKNEIMIYSFDYNLDTTFINLLKKKYGIDSPNYFVVNENEIFSGIKSLKDLEDIFENLS